MDKELLQRIEKAKEIAKSDYENLMKKHKAFNPRFKRKWREVKDEKNNRISYALEGTPDKAFVFYYPEKNRVIAVRQDGSIIKEL